MNIKQLAREESKSKVGFKMSFSPWLMWGLGAAFFFTEYVARVAPSVMVPELMKTFSVDALTIGSLSAFFSYAYVSMQMPVGVLVDRYGPHRLLTSMCMVCGLGCLLFAIASNIVNANFGRFLMGFAASFAFVGSLKLAVLWFPANRFGLLAGLTQAVGMLGAAVGQAPTSFSVAHLGWQTTLLVIAVIFLILAILIGLIVRDRPINSLTVGEPLASSRNILAGIRSVLNNRQSWWNAAYAGVVYAPTAAFAELWGVTFLAQNYHLSLYSAATVISLIFIGIGVGGPLIGWFSDRIQLRRPLMLLSAASCFILLVLMLYLPSTTPISVLLLVAFLYGVSNTGFTIAYAVASEINSRGIAGTSVALANMASVIIGTLFQPLIGWILDLNWDGRMQNGAPVYSAHAFELAFLLLPICLALGFLLAFMVKETYCQSLEIQEKQHS